MVMLVLHKVFTTEDISFLLCFSLFICIKLLFSVSIIRDYRGIYCLLLNDNTTSPFNGAIKQRVIFNIRR